MCVKNTLLKRMQDVLREDGDVDSGSGGSAVCSETQSKVQDVLLEDGDVDPGSGGSAGCVHLKHNPRLVLPMLSPPSHGPLREMVSISEPDPAIWVWWF